MQRHMKTSLARPAKSSLPGRGGISSTVRANVDVLFVEDDVANVQEASKAFAQWHLRPEAEFVSNGFNALLKLTMRVPDLLIAKIGTPNFSGISMARCIREFPEYADMPLVLIADNEREQLLAKGLGCGNCLVLQRRGSFEQLETMVESLAMSKWKRLAVRH